ncbi:hypothetical protein GALMADRAFT_135374 [Galerina marginata CBS 339.88]|uniref:Uncharacterized protein n=1 Tax=Galerina marginata (strain CBS 339.88) TaxID=685588 RepID=A0A067TI48_GALM3|nr:hypothetical protein GALMADRAFT_135374 [Galerina marginata CBS 339.88]
MKTTTAIQPTTSQRLTAPRLSALPTSRQPHPASASSLGPPFAATSQQEHATRGRDHQHCSAARGPHDASLWRHITTTTLTICDGCRAQYSHTNEEPTT